MRVLALALLFVAATAHADIGVDERVGAQTPGQLVFATPDGTPHRLAEYTQTGKPTLLVFAYARCRALCSVVLQSTSRLLRQLPERDFNTVLVGLDPNAQLEDGRRQREAMRKQLGWREDELPYLFGKQAQIAALASSVGFRYAWDARTEQYAHPAVLIALDGNGRVRQYLHALGTTPADLQAALSESTAEHASLAGDLLRCFRFDPSLRKHQRAIELYFRVGGAAVLALLASLVVGLLIWERRRRA